MYFCVWAPFYPKAFLQELSNDKRDSNHLVLIMKTTLSEMEIVPENDDGKTPWHEEEGSSSENTVKLADGHDAEDLPMVF